jgi:O-antigen/teichoic acid export membrane protein
VRSRAVGAILAQGAQAGISFVLQVLVARTLGIEELGRFAILYGVIVIVTGVVTGVVGDSLVVLDRAHAPIRSALQGTTLVLATAGGLIGAVTFLLVGLVTPIEALLFAGATALFTTEEVLRRLLMAHFAFYRVIAADLGGFAVALAIVLAAGAASASSLAVFLGAICAGQAVAIVLAVVLLPRHERRWAPAERGGLQGCSRGSPPSVSSRRRASTWPRHYSSSGASPPSSSCATRRTAGSPSAPFCAVPT